MRTIVTIGWDGRSNPIYRFHDELSLPDHMRALPTVAEVLAQFPNATYYDARFERRPLLEAERASAW